MQKIVFILISIMILWGSNFDKYFAYAQNYYWLTIDEGIKSSVYFKAKKYINSAYEELKKAPNKENQKKLDTLNKEINNFYKIKYFTMDGYFPMLRFVSTSFFFFPKKSRQHTLQKPADIIAVENASETLTNNIDIDNQLHVFFNTLNPIWNEISFEKFNAHGKYYAHLTEEIIEVLNDKELKQFYENDITPTIINKLLNYTNKEKICIVNLTKTPLDVNDLYFTAYGNVYGKNAKIEKGDSAITFGYSIDERGKWPILITSHILLLLIVLIATLILVKKQNQKLFLFIVVFIGFMVGRILPWVLVPSLESFMPSWDLNVLYTFWWVFLIGIAIILAPIYGMNLIYAKIQNYISLPPISGKGGIIGFSISAGVAGYLFVPFIFTYGDVLNLIQIVGYFSLFSVALLVSGYASGKILDKSDKTEEYYLIAFVFTSMMLFVGLVHTDLVWLSVSSIITIIISIIILKLRKKEIKKELKKVEIKEDIEKSILGENYYPFKFYDEISKNIGAKK